MENTQKTALEVYILNKHTDEGVRFYEVEHDRSYFSIEEADCESITPYLVTTAPNGDYIRIVLRGQKIRNGGYATELIKKFRDLIPAGALRDLEEVGKWHSWEDEVFEFKVKRVLRPAIDVKASISFMSEKGGLQTYHSLIYFNGKPRYEEGGTYRFDDGSTIVHYDNVGVFGIVKETLAKLIKDKFGDDVLNVFIQFDYEECRADYFEVEIEAKTEEVLRDAFAFIGVDPSVIRANHFRGKDKETLSYETKVLFGSVGCHAN